ncbi:MAG TPA: right-handed parallel beta-helix repeat-containing protein [Candidatus Methylomirabilis sp.]|nr:right-handed parallel beta-helix repeat-containing protein [Candidatus Methylomirabilis sp.]
MTLYVDGNAGVDDPARGYSGETALKTIGYAVSRIAHNGTIMIGAGTYNETISITQNFGWITFQGAGQDQTVIAGNGAAPTITVWGSNTYQFRQLTVTGGTHGIYAKAAHILCENITVRDNVTDGIRGRYRASVELSGVTVRSNGSIGVYLSNGTAGRVQNSTVTQNGNIGIDLHRGSSAEIEGSTVSYNGASGIGAYVGSSVSVGTSTLEYNALSGADASNSSAFNSWGGNVIQHNGDNSGWRGGINIHNGSSGVIINSPGDQILMNNGPGIFVGENSQILFKLSTVNGNALDGVSLNQSSTGSFESGSITNNGGFGISCGGDAKKYGNASNSSGNTLGHTNCP